MLSDMPEGGEALGQWVAMHDQGVKEMEQRAGGMVGAARHQMGLSAAHVLMGHGGPGGGAGGAVAGARGVALPMRGTDGGPMGIGPLAGTAGAGIA